MRLNKMKLSNNNRVFVVLGAHRSGTSAFSRSLFCLGIDFGENLMQANSTNPKGFFEDLDICNFNERVLSELGQSWHSLSPINESHIHTLKERGFVEEARSLILSKLSRSKNGNFGLKDPRIAKLLPFWSHVFRAEPYQTCFIIAVRNPASSARSISKRDGFDLIKSYLIWLIHVASSLIHTSASERILVDYDNLIEEPAEVVASISRKFNLAIDEVDLDNFINSFLDPALRHSAHSNDDLNGDSGCPKIVQKVYALVASALFKQDALADVEVQTHLVDLVAEIEDFGPVFEFIDKQHQNISALSTLLDKKATDLQGYISQQTEAAEFDPRTYLQLNPDLAEAGVDPSLHYIRHGMAERRRHK